MLLIMPVTGTLEEAYISNVLNVMHQYVSCCHISMKQILHNDPWSLKFIGIFVSLVKQNKNTTLFIDVGKLVLKVIYLPENTFYTVTRLIVYSSVSFLITFLYV